jgi:hypothetical protein
MMEGSPLRVGPIPLLATRAPIQKEAAVRQQPSGAITVLETFQDILGWTVKAAALVLIGVTIYYIYGTFAAADPLFHGISNNGPMPVEEFKRQLGNTELLSKIMLVSAIVLGLSAIGRYYTAAETGLVLAMVGVALFFGMPFLVNNYSGQGALAPKLAKLGDPKTLLLTRYGLAGALLMAAGVMDLVFHGFLALTRTRQKRPKANAEAAQTAAQVKRTQDQFLGPCWNLPFCRDTEKKQCPVRLNKAPCWRGGRGCYCDQNIILALSGGNAFTTSRSSAAYLSHGATIARPKTLKEKRAQCLQCPVYLHHQGQKYRLFAPLWLLAFVGALVLYRTALMEGYPKFMLWAGRSLSGFSYTNGGQDAAWVKDLAYNPGIMWMLVGVAVILVIAYLLQAVEWTLYRLGI